MAVIGGGVAVRSHRLRKLMTAPSSQWIIALTSSCDVISASPDLRMNLSSWPQLSFLMRSAMPLSNECIWLGFRRVGGVGGLAVSGSRGGEWKAVGLVGW